MTNPERAFPADYQGGMSIRDYFAGQALTGITTRAPFNSVEEYAQLAYALADAMLAERDR